MARSTTRSNQKPDTLMQDRTARIDETPCTARPDHTALLARLTNVRSTPKSGAKADIA